MYILKLYDVFQLRDVVPSLNKQTHEFIFMLCYVVYV